MKKKSKAKYIIIGIILSILLISFIFFKFFISKRQIGNIIFNIQMIGINKDIKIEELGGYSAPAPGGYASASYYYYIDLSKKKIYEIENYYVYGVTSSPKEQGDHYAIKRTKKLSNEEIDEILKLTYLKSDYDYSSYNPFSFNNEIYYSITYKQKTVNLKRSTATIISKVIANME